MHIGKQKNSTDVSARFSNYETSDLYLLNLVHLFVFQVILPPLNASPDFKVIEKIMMTVGRNMIDEQIVTN